MSTTVGSDVCGPEFSHYVIFRKYAEQEGAEHAQGLHPNHSNDLDVAQRFVHRWSIIIIDP